ncbi:DUF427 domain-containing protein [Streptomyces violaceoruber]|uniref:DUF427 domain-containing protein n=1 Tax=Streptomyces tendae TaxID=1932 RepID=UPI003D715A7B
MRAVLDGHVLAESPESETIRIEGNFYFPPSSVNTEALRESTTPYTCPWKGRSQYFNAVIGGTEVPDVAWSYPDPLPRASAVVGADFAGYVAFAPRVTLEAS